MVLVIMKRGRPPVYSEITYEELGDWAGRKTLVRVSKAWLDAMKSQPALTKSKPPPKPSPAPSLPSTEEEPSIEFNLINLNNE